MAAALIVGEDVVIAHSVTIHGCVIGNRVLVGIGGTPEGIITAAKALARAVQQLCTEEHLAFAALLVTDINTQNSLLLVKGETAFIQRIGYPHVEQDELFDLPGVDAAPEEDADDLLLDGHGHILVLLEQLNET